MGDQIERLKAALPSHYSLEREVGAGGMATVNLALGLRHDRNVAVKVLRPELAVVLGAERFLAEIRVTANLQHPHILPLHDSGESDGFLYEVTPDGQRFLAAIDEQELPLFLPDLRVVFNWFDELNARFER